jgi:hypothetical protein
MDGHAAKPPRSRVSRSHHFEGDEVLSRFEEVGGLWAELQPTHAEDARDRVFAQLILATLLPRAGETSDFGHLSILSRRSVFSGL